MEYLETHGMYVQITIPISEEIGYMVQDVKLLQKYNMIGCTKYALFDLIFLN